MQNILIKDNWLDIEQTVFLILNNLTSKKPSKFTYPVIYYHCEVIYDLLASQAHQIDNYIDIDKTLLQIEDCIRNIKEQNEINIFMKAAICMLTEFFNKINTNITSIDKITSIIKLIFLSLLDHKNILNITFDKLRISLKRVKSNFYKHKENYEYDLDLNLNLNSNSNLDSNKNENIKIQKTVFEIRDNLECFFYFILKFTNDVTNGKKIWFILENHLGKKTNSEKITNRIIDLIMLFTLGKCRYLKNFSDNIEKKNTDLAVTTILEYVSDKFFNSKINIPNDKSEYIENHSVALFSELIFNNSDLLPFSYISSEHFIEVK
jgi:hypothetical protein